MKTLTDVVATIINSVIKPQVLEEYRAATETLRRARATTTASLAAMQGR